jgi:hypothetical protein
MRTLRKGVLRGRGHVERVGMRKLHSWFWRENPKERDDFEEKNCTWEYNIKKDFQETGWQGVV